MSTERDRSGQPDIATDSLEASIRREEFHHGKAVQRLNKKLNRILGLSRESTRDWTLIAASGEQSLSWNDFRRGPSPSRPTAITVVEDLVIGAVNMSIESLFPIYSFRLLDHHYPTPDDFSNRPISTEFRNKADLGKILAERDRKRKNNL